MASKPTKTKENGKTVYRDGNGKKISSSEYSKQLKAYEESNAIYTSKTTNGKTTYYRNGKSISKSTYQKNTANKTTYSTKTQNGTTTYYKNGQEISKKAYNNLTSSDPKPYEDGGRYYDKSGNEISESSYNSQMKSYNDKKALENSTIQWSKKTAYQDEFRPQLEDLAKKIANNEKLTLQEAKAIEDNPEYINLRDSIAKSLTDGTYYNQETDPYAQQYRNDYIRQGQRAMDDTMANLSRRTGGLASSYAGAVAQSKYNDYMDELASKLIDLRSLAEATARNNVGMYDTMNNEYRTGQLQNNDVIAQNNSARAQEWNAYMNQLQSALGAYQNLSDSSFNRWATGQQMYENARQFDTSMGAKMAAANTPTYSSGGSSRGGSSSGGSGGSGDTGSAVVNIKNPDGTMYVSGLGDVTRSQAEQAVKNGTVNKSTNNLGETYYTNNVGIDYKKDPRYSK